jgi:ABC-type glycerol-3-phosphate transport system permease component
MSTFAEAGEKALPRAATTYGKRLPQVRVGRIILYAILIAYGLFSVAPFLFALSSSFKTAAQVSAWPPSFIPHPATLSSYQTIFSGNDLFPRYILNSAIYAVAAAVFSILFGAMAGYAFGRMEFPGKTVLYGLTLAVMMIPSQLILIPKFLVVNALSLANNYGGLIVPALVGPVSVILMTQFLKTLPRELEESAMIDGCSRFRAFWQIILPLVRPAMTVTGLLAFQGAWNDFIWPLIVMSSQNNYTLTVGLAFFKGVYFTNYSLVLAGTMISIAPLVIIFFIFQRYFMQSLSTVGLAGR